jgi:hypothetical protein
MPSLECVEILTQRHSILGAMAEAAFRRMDSTTYGIVVEHKVFVNAIVFQRANIEHGGRPLSYSRAIALIDLNQGTSGGYPEGSATHTAPFDVAKPANRDLS